MQKVFLFIIGVLFAPFAAYVLYGAGLWVFGYYIWDTPATLAAKLVEYKRPAHDCFLLRTVDIGPRTSQYEMQMECVFDYASLAKDPSACELLMPSSYGLSCVGGARELSEPCYVKQDRSVGGNGIKASLAECLSGPTNIQNNSCCLISKVAMIVGYDDCSPVKNDLAMYDQCLNELAFKKKDPTFCKNIDHANTRTACIVQTKALQKDPSICSGCTPPLESIESLTQ